MSALLLAYLGFVAIGLPDGALGLAWPSLREAFALPQSGLALLLLAQTVGYLVAGNAAGSLLRRAGVGRVLAGSTALVAAAALLYAAAPVLPLLPLAAFVLGLGSAAIDAGLNAHAAAHFSARHMTWLHAAYGLGAALGPVVLTWGLATSGTWRLGYGVLAVTLGALALLFWARRDGWATTPPVRTGTPVGGLGAGNGARGLAVLQVLVFAVYTGVEAAAGQWSFAVSSEGRGLAVPLAGTGTALFWTGLTLGRVAIGLVADRMGADRLVRLGAAGTLLGAVVFWLAPNPLALAGLATMGVALAPIFPMLMLRTAERFAPDLARRLFGLQVSAAMLGALALPSLAGAFADLTSLAAIPPLLVGAAALLLAMLLALTRQR